MKKFFFVLGLSDVVFIMLKMPTIVGILTFMSRINFLLSRVEHGKRCITSGPGCLCVKLYAHKFKTNIHLADPRKSK